MKYLNWSLEKNEIIKDKRGISFEQIAYLIESDQILGIEENPGRPDQKIYILEIENYAYIVPFVELIQSVDSLKLLGVINKEAGKVNRKIKCLLQVHIAQEETKFGFSENEILELVNKEEFNIYENIDILCFLLYR